MADETLDVVCTWVDDSFPGFNEERQRYARTKHDLNPNRTRDNLDLLKFVLRSLERHAPWRGTIYIVTCRPQVPRWMRLDHPGLKMVYLDEIMPPEILPSFNAFGIESYLHCIPGLSRRFLTFNDDMLLFGPTRASDFQAEDGRLKLYFEGQLPSANKRVSERISPFNASLVNTARLLEETLGPRPRPHQAHHPRVVDQEDMREVIERWPEAFARTRASRFRGHDNVLPHILMAAYLIERGRAVAASPDETRRRMHYVGLENIAIWNWWQLRRVRGVRPSFLALNDNYGARPRAAAEAVARRFLEETYPDASSFES